MGQLALGPVAMRFLAKNASDLRHHRARHAGGSDENDVSRQEQRVGLGKQRSASFVWRFEPAFLEHLQA